MEPTEEEPKPKWRPLSRKDDESYDALYEGIPEWLRSTILAFVQSELMSQTGLPGPDAARIRRAERELRKPLDWGYGVTSAYEQIINAVRDDDTFALDFVHWCLKTTQDGGAAFELGEHLEEGGSVWKLEFGGTGPALFGLERRVDDTTAEAAKVVLSSAGRAGQHLARAWNKAYGRDPDASGAYREAVRAVEAIAVPVISPNNSRATLGTLIAEVRKTPEKWQVALTPRSGDAMLMVLETMQLLWTSQLDRHGTSDESVPLDVPLKQAQAALHLSIALVEWFRSGVISARA